VPADHQARPICRRVRAGRPAARSERGITYFDTAPGYGGGHLGGDHRPRASRRPAAGLPCHQDAADELRRRGGIRESVETSLRLLKTDYVDLLQFHGSWYADEDVDSILQIGLPIYERLRNEGKVRFLAFTPRGRTARPSG